MNKNRAENIKILFWYRSSSYIILYIMSHYDFYIPYLEALVLWVIEQLQVFCFGGSPTYSILRSFTNIAASCSSYAILFYYINVADSRIPGKYVAHYRLPWIIFQANMSSITLHKLYHIQHLQEAIVNHPQEWHLSWYLQRFLDTCLA